MANIAETSNWDEGIYQIETTDQVIGGSNGISNKQAKGLANRTKWLKDALTTLQTAFSNLGSAAGKAANATKKAGDIPVWDSLYSKSEIDNLLSAMEVPLAKGTFIPDKGDPASDWNTYVVPIGKTLDSEDYDVKMTLYGTSADSASPQDAAGTLHIISQTTTSFTVFLSMLISNKGQSGMKIKWRIYAA